MHLLTQLQEDARTVGEPNDREIILWDGVHRRPSIVGIISVVGWRCSDRDNNKCLHGISVL
jgi:hypothetical protein